MRRIPLAAMVGVSIVATTATRAATIQVGPGQTFTTPCAALATASAGDEIDIAVGTYTDTCEVNQDGVHLKGVDGRPKIDLTGGSPADAKGIYVINGDNVIVESLELTGAAVSVADGANGAGLRIQSNGVVVTNCYIHDNQDGILATATTGGGTVTIEYTELGNNGLGNACDTNSCVHNVYIGTGGGGEYAKLVFEFNWDHALATDTADKGHLLKSRALESDILYNRISGETGHDSYEVDLPNGGLGLVVGNVIEKGANPDNSILLDYGEEGYGAGTNDLYVVGNTFVNDYTRGTFIEVASGGTLVVAHDNVLAGPGTPSSTGTLSADNLAGTEASFLFVGANIYDYHLQMGSPAIGKAVPPGSAGAMALTPVFQYVQPLASVPRTGDQDVGAFEYGTNATNPTDDAGAASLDGSAGASPGVDAGVELSDGAVSDGGGTVPPSRSSGCGCNAAGTPGGLLGLWSGAGVLALGWRRRRRSATA
jgi:hypothetical protein